MKKTITVKEVEYLAFKLAQEMMSSYEPIPDFATRFPNILESCLATPFQSFDQKSLYPGLISKAGILFYLMIKNHPFQNGNKRIAMTTLFVFLYKNGKWLRVDTQELYNFTVWIAQSPPKFKKETVQAIEKFLKIYMIGLEE
ncbi:MAG: type II toxin-antitoxin system death-on-curing family toxin [Candidatus Aminicenantes bacterium]|nr:type II toxin-antitoxin system death-on-curing family toxin [Candidatus Aminicenantes bacterium]